ncbi:MAG: J domain-containing protein [Thermaerobacter sp.]|nr:J domain-containing protein [Thermaerobacter sp.]
MAESYYDILEISPNASLEEIKKAYHRMARLTHPDTGGDPMMMRRVIEAYETLSDVNRRYVYDLRHRANNRPNAGDHSKKNRQHASDADEARNKDSNTSSEDQHSPTGNPGSSANSDHSPWIFPAESLNQGIPRWHETQILLGTTNRKISVAPIYALGIAFLVWASPFLLLGAVVQNRSADPLYLYAQDYFVVDEYALQWRGLAAVEHVGRFYDWNPMVTVYPNALSRWLLQFQWLQPKVPRRLVGYSEKHGFSLNIAVASLIHPA